MKHTLCGMLAVLLLFLAVLPLAGVTLPQNAMAATTQEAMSRALGVDTPGAAVVLYENGEHIMTQGYGYADIGARTLVSSETAFEIGGLSSLFVALAVRSLSLSGALDPNVSIAQYLPSEFMEKLSLSYPVTTADLLYCMAGFEGRTFDLRFAKDTYCFDSLEQALLAEVPKQQAAPGTYYSYSAFGIGVAAYVVECVAGKSYTAYVRETILEPLGMFDTHLDPRHDTPAPSVALGHETKGEGKFAVSRAGGRSYSGIFPADGALSTAADLSVLLSHLLQTDLLDAATAQSNGVFLVGVGGGRVSGSVYSLRSQTTSFGVSLCVDVSRGQAALVMTNAKDSELLLLPSTLCGFSAATSAQPSGERSDLSLYEGVYADAAFERDSLVGRLFIKDYGEQVTLREDGLLEFSGMTLREIAPGIFTDAASEESVAVVQFLTSDTGEVLAVLTADGTTYLPVTFLERPIPSMLLFLLLLAGAVYAVCGAFFAVTGALRAHKHGLDDRPWRYVLPRIFSGLVGALALAQTWTAITYRNAVIGSFFTAMSVIAILFAILATLSYLFALFASFAERGRASRVVRSAVVYVLFLILCGYWHIVYV